MAEEPEEIVVLCNRVADSPAGVYGSTREACHDCKQPVWLSPATRSTVEKASPTYKILCLACGQKRLEEKGTPDDKLMLPSAEQWREILKGIAEQN